MTWLDAVDASERAAGQWDEARVVAGRWTLKVDRRGAYALLRTRTGEYMLDRTAVEQAAQALGLIVVPASIDRQSPTAVNPGLDGGVVGPRLTSGE
jgi:hypothetical protein